MNYGKTLVVFALFSCALGRAAGGDTPFLKYDCSVFTTTDQASFYLEFANDNQKEIQSWSSHLKRTKIRFEKQDKDHLSVNVITGIPLVGYATPEQYRFSAPLTTDQFDFVITLKEPVKDGTRLSLQCVKWKEE